MMPNEEAILERITHVLNYTYLHLLIITVVVVLMLWVASKVFMEDFEFVEYLTMCTMIIVVTFLFHFVVPVMFIGFIDRYDFLSRTDIILIRWMMFGAYLVLLFFPILFILRNSFMFFKPRFFLSVIYVLILSVLLVIFAQV